MRNLLRNDLVTLFKSKIFWIAALVLFGMLYLYDEGPWIANDIIEDIKANKDITHCYLAYIGGVFAPTFMSFYLGGIIPLIIGYDFDGGMIRNKIMAGHSRTKIYFSTLIESLVSGSIYCLIAFAYQFCSIMSNLGFVLTYGWMNDALFIKMLVCQIIILLVSFIAIVSLPVALTMDINLKAVAIIMFILLYSLFASFAQPVRKFATDINPTLSWVNDNNEIEYTDNPYYIPLDAPEKKVFLALDSINIFGSFEGFPLENMYSKDYVNESIRYVVGTAVMILVINSVGILVFNKRNLK